MLDYVASESLLSLFGVDTYSGDVCVIDFGYPDLSIDGISGELVVDCECIRLTEVAFYIEYGVPEDLFLIGEYFLYGFSVVGVYFLESMVRGGSFRFPHKN